jgi:hypothetical protein
LPEVHYNAHSPAGNKKNSKENNSSNSSARKRKFNNKCKLFSRGKGGKAMAKHHHLTTTVSMLAPGVVAITIPLRNVVAQNTLFFYIKTPSRS